MYIHYVLSVGLMLTHVPAPCAKRLFDWRLFN